MLDAQDQWQRIEPTGLIREEQVDLYFLQTDDQTYYFLVSGFDMDSIDDYFLLISRGDELNSQDIKIFFYSLLALDLNIKKQQAGFAERHQEILDLLMSGRPKDDSHIRNTLERYNISLAEKNMLIAFDLKIRKLDVRKLFYDLLALQRQHKIEDGHYYW